MSSQSARTDVEMPPTLTPMRVLRSGLTLVVGGFLFLEVLFWVRYVLLLLLLSSYPHLAMTPTGQPLRWQTRSRRIAAGNGMRSGKNMRSGKRKRSGNRPRYMDELRFLDEAGSPVTEWSSRRSPSSAQRAVAMTRLSPWLAADAPREIAFEHLLRSVRDTPGGVLRMIRRGSGTWDVHLAHSLQAVESRGRPSPATIALVAENPLGPLPRVLNDRGACDVKWAFEGGRFLARHSRTGAVLAGFGPDGFVRGASGADGTRFGELERVAVRLHEFQARHQVGCAMALLEPETNSVYMICGGVFPPVSPSPPPEPGVNLPRTRPADEPIEVRVVRFSQPAEAGRLRHLVSALERMGGRLLHGFVLRDDRSVHTLSWDGTQHRTFDIPADTVTIGHDRMMSRTGAPPGSGWIFARGALNPFHIALTHQFVPPGGELVSFDRVATPQTAEQTGVAALYAAYALLRPPVLALATGVSGGARTLPEFFFDVWHEPLFGGTAGRLWVCVSLLVGALCGLRAHLQGRMRFATRGARVAWTVACALLGPFGLFWMSLSVPKLPLSACAGCGHRRAVSLPTCGGCGEPWEMRAPDGPEFIA